MKRYKIAAWLMIIHGGFMEIGGVLCALPALILRAFQVLCKQKKLI